MTETCLPIVTWLKNWFTSKDNEIHYNITSSNYNPNIDSTVTITVTVTDGNGALVDGHSFILNANGTDVSLSTINGVATYTYTCNDWGMKSFSVDSSNCQINVTGWRIAQNDSNYFLKYNDKLVFARVSVTESVNWSTTVGHLGAEWLKDPNHPEINLRPRMRISASQAPNKTVMLADNDYRVGFFTHTGTGTGGLYASFTYARNFGE